MARPTQRIANTPGVLLQEPHEYPVCNSCKDDGSIARVFVGRERRGEGDGSQDARRCRAVLATAEHYSITGTRSRLSDLGSVLTRCDVGPIRQASTAD